jgi:tetratricopeptide (TPR) repeat protein
MELKNVFSGIILQRNFLDRGFPLSHLKPQHMAVAILFFFGLLSNFSIVCLPLTESAINQTGAQITEKLIGDRNQEAQDLRKNGQYSKALELARETLSLVKQNNLKNKEPETFYLLGTIQRMMGNYNQALVSFRTSLEVAESLKNQIYITLNQNGIGNIYLTNK